MQRAQLTSCLFTDYGQDGKLPATCVDISTGGGLQFKCRECSRSGYQPFSGVTAISFWIRSNSSSYDASQTSTPKGQVQLTHTYVYPCWCTTFFLSARNCISCVYMFTCGVEGWCGVAGASGSRESRPFGHQDIVC